MWVLIFLAGGTLGAYAQTDEAPKKRHWWEGVEAVEVVVEPDPYVGIPAPHVPSQPASTPKGENRG